MKDFGKIKTYIFDFDGTLVNSVPYLKTADETILKRYGGIVPDNLMDIVIPLGVPGSAKYFIEKLNVKATEERLISDFNDLLTEFYKNEIMPKNKVAENLKRFRSEGKSLNILTASPHIWIEPCLKRCNLKDYFDNVWSCEDFNTTKQDPEIYVKVAERLNKSVEECAFFDDNINSVKAGVKSGMFTVGVFDETSKNIIKEIKSASDKYVYDFDEI